MKLTEIELCNFKVFGGSTKIPIRPITLIFGPNSAGKSSIIQSLLLMKQTATTEVAEGDRLQFRGSVVDLGSYPEVVHGRDPSKSLSIGVTFDLSDEELALESGLVLEDPKLSLRTNFIAGQGVREGIVASIEGVLSDQKVILKSVTETSEEPNSKRTEVLKTFRQRSSSPAMYLSKASSCSLDIYEAFLNPLIQKAIERLTSRIEELRDDYETTPEEELGTNPVPEAVKTGTATQFIFHKLTKADVEKDLARHERLYSALSSYTSKSFRKDFESAIDKVCVGLRGCILDSSQLVDQNFDLLYPNLERTLGSRYYAEKFKELLANEFFIDGQYVDADDEVPWGEWENVYTQQYLILTRNWLLHLTLIGADVYRKFLQKLSYIGPMRQFPSRYYLPESNVVENVGKSGEFSPTLLFQRDSLLKDANRWLEYLGLDYQFEVAKLVAKETDFEEGVFALRLRKPSGIVSSMVDVGFGVSQVLPVVLQCVLSNTSTVCIEQPEIHLHPALQAELGDLFIESALGDRKNILIIETHSEHLILRLMRRMRDTVKGKLPGGLPAVRPEDISVLYIQPMDEGSVVRVLELDEEGQLLDPFPGGFFEEGFHERFA